MRKLSAIFAVIALLALAVVPSFAQDEDPTIVDIVVAQTEAEEPEFTVLLEAVLAADPAIAEALSNPDGLYTVFAPTDAAFVALLEELGLTAEELLADTDLLNEVLMYHVAPIAFDSTSIAELDGALLGTLLEGTAVSISAGEDGVFIDDSEVINVDITASNGVVHVIDSVLLPPMGDDMMEEDMEEDMDEEEMMEAVSIAETVIAATEAETPEFTVLLEAVVTAGLAEVLTNNGPFTVFAPTDEAFAAALEALGLTAEELLADVDTLTDILAYHVVPGTFYAEDVIAGTEAMGGSLEVATALNGTTATIAFDGETATINEAIIIGTDIEATNGVIHIIDSVILPPVEEE